MNAAIRLFIITSVLALTPAAFAQSESAPSTAATTTAPEKVEKVTRDYKDAFLAFALEKAEKYSGTAEQAVSKAVDVAAQEAPLLAREFIVWRAWMHGINGTLPIMAFAVFLTLFCKQWGKWTMTTDRYYQRLATGSVGNVIATVIGGVGSLATFIISMNTMSHLLSFVQVLVAPRVYMVEQVLNLLGK